jgi:hypothetical protein
VWANDHGHEELLHLLARTIVSNSTSYILVDAMDECDDKDELEHFLREVVEWRDKPLRFLFTSRKERYIEDALTRLEYVNLLLASGTDSNASNIFGQTAFGHNAAEDDVKSMSMFINEDVRGQLDRAMYVAVGHGHAQVVQSLLERGADPNTVWHEGCALYVAAIRGRKAVDILLQWQAGTEVVGEYL